MLENEINELIKKYTIPVFSIGLILLLGCLLGNIVGFIGCIISLDVNGSMWHLERFTYYVPMLALFMGVIYAADIKKGEK
jgi:hypothetical protein